MTLPSAYTNNGISNRVWIICTNLTIASGGSINVDGKGYARGTPTTNGHGPGGGGTGGSGGGGGGHGGVGSRGYDYGAGVTYGSTNEPLTPGSGGGGRSSSPTAYGADGGGAVLIEAAGAVVVNGTVSANGNTATVNTAGGGGSGGAVYITCNTFAGTNGIICANGGSYGGGATFAGGTNGLLQANGSAGYTSGYGGGGGRIAVWRRADRHFYQGSYSVTNGTGYTNDAEVGTVFLGQLPIQGTMFMIL